MTYTAPREPLEITRSEAGVKTAPRKRVEAVTDPVDAPGTVPTTQGGIEPCRPSGELSGPVIAHGLFSTMRRRLHAYARRVRQFRPEFVELMSAYYEAWWISGEDCREAAAIMRITTGRESIRRQHVEHAIRSLRRRGLLLG